MLDERADAADFIRLKRRGQAGHRRKRGFDLAQSLDLCAPPFAEEFLAQRFIRQHSVHDDGVARKLE